MTMNLNKDISEEINDDTQIKIKENNLLLLGNNTLVNTYKINNNYDYLKNNQTNNFNYDNFYNNNIFDKTKIIIIISNKN